MESTILLQLNYIMNQDSVRSVAPTSHETKLKKSGEYDTCPRHRRCLKGECCSQGRCLLVKQRRIAMVILANESGLGSLIWWLVRSLAAPRAIEVVFQRSLKASGSLKSGLVACDPLLSQI